jgi:type VI secretion system protein ImpG
MGFGPRVEVMLFLDRAMPRLEPEIDREHFRLGCVPIVNLFEQIAEPIQLNQSKFEYRVVADVQNQLGKEVYSVDSVTSTDPTTSTATEYFPFYRFDHGAARGSRQAFWYASRRPPAAENDRGTEVYLNLVDRAFDPRQPAVSTLIVRATCTNRDLPNQLQHAG